VDIDKIMIGYYSLVSQEWKRFMLYHDGRESSSPTFCWIEQPGFRIQRIYISDVDQDGDDDILYTTGMLLIIFHPRRPGMASVFENTVV